jgi:DNA ligase D-like protein (predicted 3'-phosphoesterase)
MNTPIQFGRYRWVIKEHQASSLHWDFGVEWGGVQNCWALKAQPTMVALTPILAIARPHHKVQHLYLEWVVPAGRYGAGPKAIWDHGTYVLMTGAKSPAQQFQLGHIRLFLEGTWLKGLFTLRRQRPSGDTWMFFKEDDGHALESWISRRVLTPEKLAELRNRRRPEGPPQLGLF